MNSYIIFKKKIYVFAFLSIVFIASAIISGLYFKREHYPSKATTNLQITINQKERELINIIENIKNDFIIDTDFNFLDFYDFDNLFEDKGFEILIYINDTLKYWSDNIAPVNSIYDDKIFTNNISHLENGWYKIINTKYNNTIIIGLLLIKHDFPYQNDYLINNFQKDFALSPETSIFLKSGEYNIYDLDGKFLFSILFPDEIQISESRIFLLFLMYLAGFIFFIIFLYYFYKSFNFIFKNKTVFLLVLAADIIILRFFLFYFDIPRILYESTLFSPHYYATSQFLPSPGDLLVNSFLLLILSFLFFKLIKPGFKILRFKPFNKYLITFLLFSLSFGFFIILNYLLSSLVINSTISLNLNNIFSISGISFIGFVIFPTLIISYFFISAKLLDLAYKYSASVKNYLLIFLFSLVIFILLFYFFKITDVVSLIFLVLYICSFCIIFKKNNTFISFSIIAFYLVLFSLLSTYILHKSNNIKEEGKRDLLAVKLSLKNDPLAEHIFDEVNTSILSDSILLTDIFKSQFSDSVEIIACEKIKSKFSDTFWSKYNILVTICYKDKILNVQPENYLINCKDYFNDIIDDFGKLTTTDNLYFLDINSEESNYIVSYFFAGNQNFNIDSVFLFIELSSKFIPEGLGYPELLIDKEANINPNLSNYSYAKYKNDELIYKFGNYYYSLKLSNYHNKYDSIPQSFIRNGFNHTHYKIDSSTDLILSNKSETFLDIIAPFSYLLIFYSIYLFIFLAIIYLPFNRYRIELNFRNRLQFSIVSIILFSFIIIGFSTLLYIIKLNNDKNHTILSEKAHSILIELEHKLADEESLTPDMHEYLSKLLNKFSLVFFSDINLYDLNGNLIASSRPKIFDEGLVSDKINTIAFRHLVINKKLLFIQNEKIGNHDYLSAYVPFLNEQNKLIAYLNLPYFAKQTELKNEISTFLTAFINIYVLLFAIAIFIAIVISRYITKPLKLLENKISKLQLGKLNEKIEWIRKDEIGSLVIEYNRMIDELANSAELLAKSERESAWREMAKQVAHEIKNPLTPMKLSVQYLKKAWDEKVSDWEQRLNRFSQTIIEQIDSLSTIASEFSDFAKMPQTKNEKIELSKIIRSSINLFKDVKFVDINFEAGKDKKYFVFADEKQILRVFNNLIKNSIQAISSTDGGKIDISINPENEFYIIKITDNGSGIPKEQADKIFFPSFTTKSGGMGLGLAIVKSIVIDAGGKIWFESQEGKGTTFKIKLPVYI